MKRYERKERARNTVIFLNFQTILLGITKIV